MMMKLMMMTMMMKLMRLITMKLMMMKVLLMMRCRLVIAWGNLITVNSWSAAAAAAAAGRRVHKDFFYIFRFIMFKKNIFPLQLSLHLLLYKGGGAIYKSQESPS